MEKEIPVTLQEYLGSYNEQLYDSICGEVTAWGYKIIKHCGDDIWGQLSKYGQLECCYPNWYLITKRLTIEEAIEKYGKITKLVTGPRGGYKSVLFGKIKFCVKELDPRNTDYAKNIKIIIEN